MLVAVMPFVAVMPLTGGCYCSACRQRTIVNASIERVCSPTTGQALSALISANPLAVSWDLHAELEIVIYKFVY